MVSNTEEIKNNKELSEIIKKLSKSCDENGFGSMIRNRTYGRVIIPEELYNGNGMEIENLDITKYYPKFWEGLSASEKEKFDILFPGDLISERISLKQKQKQKQKQMKTETITFVPGKWCKFRIKNVGFVGRTYYTNIDANDSLPYIGCLMEDGGTLHKRFKVDEFDEFMYIDI